MLKPNTPVVTLLTPDVQILGGVTALIVASKRI
jgi:hypothetical protein